MCHWGISFHITVHDTAFASTQSEHFAAHYNQQLKLDRFIFLFSPGRRSVNKLPCFAVLSVADAATDTSSFH